VRLFLQMPPGRGQPPRFYHLVLQEDLLGGWNLVREWGVTGRAGFTRRDHFEDRDGALSALVEARDRQLQRGYRLMYVDGGTGPAEQGGLG